MLIKQVIAKDVSNFSITELLPDSPGTNITADTTLAGFFNLKNFSLINLIFIIIGLIFFVNLILAGWEYMLSSGDPKKVQVATTRLVNGFVGLIMAFAAFIIVRLITNILGLGNLV